MTYPESFPLSEVQDVISMLLKHKPADVKVAAHSLWVTSGYVLKLTVGDPAVGMSALSADDPWSVVNRAASFGAIADTQLSNEDAVALLQTLVVLNDQPIAAKTCNVMALGDSFSISGGFLQAQLAKILLPFLLNQLKKWLLEGGLENLLK